MRRMRVGAKQSEFQVLINAETGQVGPSTQVTGKLMYESGRNWLSIRQGPGSRELAWAGIMESVTIPTEIGPHSKHVTKHSLENSVASHRHDRAAVAIRTGAFQTETQRQARK